ncbi:class I SAM-dependent methyltransferase [Pleurocapsa sp. PCC 7319]|uniref:class I SAM-dependent methyltransferase n=1 Tax=Pleurocapsa sp. PCC 7319 TaxID=118161 RepID=UPI000348CEC7|nr:class I SAM-dependent methyltransferase [Pleurocapsa sp. PCC 7319]
MLRQWLIDMATPHNKSSVSAKLRAKRFVLFKSLLTSTSYPLKILDVGGRETIWSREGFCNPSAVYKYQITILNIYQEKTNFPNIKSIVGDARNMSQFADGEFDIVFSNSVIEHVGDYKNKMQMAKEIQRVGKKYFVQTPNFYFPIEPHFVYPFFQFLPLQIKVWILMHIGRRRKKIDSQEQAKNVVNGINLLTKKEFIKLFPKASIFEEKFLGLTKSFIAYEK